MAQFWCNMVIENASTLSLEKVNPGGNVYRVMTFCEGEGLISENVKWFDEDWISDNETDVEDIPF